ncbi:MAG: hypothetical protein HOV67_19315 [Kribbellaceae bacterium]|nr:hypothetical protein [Catenulispora sp.]NUR97394.1 hypothetical protein [Kribbellaceae bacterium]
MFHQAARGRLMLGAAAVVLVAGLVTWVAWPRADGDPPPRERTYRDLTACLLTDDKGLLNDPAKSVWAGMQEVSVAKSVRVQYRSIAGAQTTANGLPYFNSLAQQQCAVIVAAGPVPLASMQAGMAKFTGIRYAVVGADPSEASVVKATPDDVRSLIAGLADAAKP